MSLTLNRVVMMANLLLAYKKEDSKKFDDLLDRCKAWMEPSYYNFFFNLRIKSNWTRKGYLKK